MKQELTSLTRSRMGFTIVELLVVIAIILMLVALLMPTLNHIRETAKNTKCISNLRQISMATFLYASDNQGLAPWNSDMTKKSYAFTRWSRDPSDGAAYVSDYPQNKWFAEYFPEKTKYGYMNQVAYCPKGGRLGDMGANVSVTTSYNKVGNIGNVSYGLNPNLVNAGFFFDNKWSDKNAVPLPQIKQPGKVSLWADSPKNYMYPKAWNLDGRHFSNSKEINGDMPTVGPFTSYRSHGRANVAYVDGRVGFITVSGPSDALEVSPDPNTQFWNPEATDKPYPEWQAKEEGWTTLPPHS